MTPQFADIACASLPPDALPLLANLRCEPGLQVAVQAGRLWLRFDAGSAQVLRTILPLFGLELFAHRDSTWHRFGQSLPAFDVPNNLAYRPLAHVLFPAAVQPLPAGEVPLIPMPLTLTPDERPRPTTAMRCTLKALLAWANRVPSTRLGRMVGVTQPEQILVIGDALPILDGAERFWGKLVLMPLGFVPVPALPEAALRDAAGVRPDELLLIGRDAVEALPRTLLAPLSRAGLRLAQEGRR
jgi:hypothetical protein